MVGLLHACRLVSEALVFYAFRVILPMQRCRECMHLWLIFMRCCDI